MTCTQDALLALVDRLKRCEAVAFDTEFVWERTYHPRLGLIQVGWEGGNTALVDAAKLYDLSPLGKVLADPGIVKVLHDAQQDLTILRRATGAVPLRVFDTRRAAGFVGLGATLSLYDLVHTLLGVRLPKTETRSDWLQRPLTGVQTSYARDDVRHLLAARRAILDRSAGFGRTDWLLEEMAVYDDPALSEERDPTRAYLRIPGGGRLTTRQRTALRELAAWRQREARRRDVPRGFVLADKTLLEIARRLPRSAARLRSVHGLGTESASRYGNDLTGAVRAGIAASVPAPRPERLPNDDAHVARVHLAMAFLVGRGMASGIDPALCASRADVSALIANGMTGDHSLLCGWRRRFVGRDLVKVIRGERAVRIDPATGYPAMA